MCQGARGAGARDVQDFGDLTLVLQVGDPDVESLIRLCRHYVDPSRLHALRDAAAN